MTAPGTAPNTPSARYQDGIDARRWQRDPAQAEALAVLDTLQRELLAARADAREHHLLDRFRALLGEKQVPDAPRGLYLWGAVGRGKTFLMDLFAASLPHGLALRRHFHQFMEDTHEALRALKHKQDPLDTVAAELAARARVLCLDEFLVDDIGDAMILHGLLRGMFDRGMVLVTTSNTPPAELYRDGLQRARFVPAIRLIEARCRVLELKSGHDWRLRALAQAPIYQTPPGAEATRALERIFKDYAHGPVAEGGSIEIHLRQIPVVRRAANIIWFDFPALCEGPRSRADYVELAAHFSAIVVGNVPVFTPQNNDAAKRFIHLVDALYDSRVKLVLSAAAPLIALYEGNRLRAEFGRTQSRLIEMQSEDYLRQKHHPASTVTLAESPALTG